MVDDADAAPAAVLAAVTVAAAATATTEVLATSPAVVIVARSEIVGGVGWRGTSTFSPETETETEAPTDCCSGCGGWLLRGAFWDLDIGPEAGPENAGDRAATAAAATAAEGRPFDTAGANNPALGSCGPTAP